MEPEMLAFLKKVSKSLFIALLWLGINAIVAIKNDNAFIGDHITIGNVLFYVWLVISIFILIYFYKKMWAKR